MTPETAVSQIARWIETGERQYVCVTGVHGVMEAQRDRALLDIHNGSGLTVPDGMPMVWASHWAGARWVSRVYGPDLMRRSCEAGAQRGWRMFLYGSAPEVVETLAERLPAEHAGLAVVGAISPPYRNLSPDEEREIARQINSARADIVWVGLSTPKQERWMARNRGLLDAPVLVGVGAAFDMLSGRLKQAPPWMRDRGLEWAYRLLQEPSRLWRRYARNNPAFALAIARRRPRLLDS